MASYGLLPEDMNKTDTIGYRTRGELYHKNIHETPSVDSMILEARKNLQDYEQMAQKARQRENDILTTLGKIAELFPKGLTLPVEKEKKDNGKVHADITNAAQNEIHHGTKVNAPRYSQRIIPSGVQRID